MDELGNYTRVSPDMQALTPPAPTPSMWQVVSVFNNLIRKTNRLVSTGWRMVAGEAVAGAREELRQMHIHEHERGGGQM